MGVGAFLTALFLCLPSTPATAVTRAGVGITNVARIDYQFDGQARSEGSNTVSTVVQEILGIGLSATGTASLPLVAGQTSAAPFLLTNAGNGTEAFVLGGTISGIDATLSGFAIDQDGNGRFDPAIDTPIAIGGTTPLLGSGTAIRLLALVAPNGTAAGSGRLDVTAHAATGSGQPGTLFEGRGDGGIDAVVGPTTAAAALVLPLGAGGEATVTLEKSQQVTAPDGTANPIQGAIIAYTIAARFDGTGTSRTATITDPIPSGTDYVPGSLRLDGTALTDVADADAGGENNSAIAVALGDVAAPATHSISFQVKIR